RGTCAYRCAGEGHSLRAFKAFSPAVLSGIGTLPGTLHDRSIHIPLVKAQPGEVATPFNEKNIDLERTLARKIARWCLDNFDALRNLASGKPVSPANQSCSSALPACRAEAPGERGLTALEPGGGDTLSASNGDHNSRREQPNLGNNIVADLGSHWEEGRGVDCSFGSTPVQIENPKSSPREIASVSRISPGAKIENHASSPNPVPGFGVPASAGSEIENRNSKFENLRMPPT